MKQHKVNKLNNFIGGWYLEDLSLCDKLVNYFNISENKKIGALGKGVVNKEWKDSTDCQLCDKVLLSEYFNALVNILDHYKVAYTYCDKYSPWGLVENINIQHYKPGGGFHKWHTERTGALYPYNARHIVFMTYLNTVKNKGETEFFYQKVKIKPEKGLTLIWPADWTFTHRGIASPSEEKYILTGWLNYLECPSSN